MKLKLTLTFAVQLTIVAALVVIGLFASLALQPRAAAQSGPPTRIIEIQDPIFGITAYRMPIPQDWRFEGILLRDPACGMTPTVAYRATSPDGLSGEQEIPAVGWHWSDDPANVQVFRKSHCKIMMPMSATDFLKYVIPVVRPGSTIIRISPTADAQQWESTIQQSNQRAAQMGIKTRTSGGGMRARLEYSFHGQALEDNLAVRLTCTQQQIGMYGGPPHSSWDCNAAITSVRAPKGQLDAALPKITGILAQGAYTDQWMQENSQQTARNNDRVMAGIRAQGQATASLLKNNHDQYMREQQARVDASQQIDRDRSAAMHNDALAYTLYAGDEQLVRNPGTGEVSRVTTSYGNNGWQDKTSAEILMTDDANLNPNLYLRGEWSQLENINPIKP